MYNQFYNFSEKPFNLTPDPKFLYYTPSHREALASMVYGINERRGFVAITGEVGTGKTTLIYTLLSNLNEKVKTAFVYHTTDTFEELLAHILIDLKVNIATDQKVSLLQKLNEYLTHNVSADETLAIIIDEAQNLPIKVMEEFRLLSNIETSKQKLLQILLVGQPELDVLLNSPDLRQLKQRIGIRRTIQPLSQQESREYIEHRLSIVGSSCDNVFTPDALSLICKHANGIPRVINIICDNAFLIGYSLSQKRITAKIINEVIGDLNAGLAVTSPPDIRESAIAPSEKKSSNIGFYLVSLILLIALGVISLAIRGFFKPDTTPQNVVELTEITPAQTTIPAEPPPKPQEDPLPPEPQQEALPQAPVTVKKKTAKTALLKEGGSLYSLALKNYGRANPTIYDLILKANPGITDIRKIPDSKVIILPEITPESFIEKRKDTGYLVHAGTFDTRRLAALCEDKVQKLVRERTSVKARTFSPRDTCYRVTVGNFASKEEALNTVNLLASEKIISLP